MSSPGNAAWCMSVRMSPGSTTTTPIPSRTQLGGERRDASSSAALLAPYPPHVSYAPTAASDVTFTMRPLALAQRWQQLLDERDRRHDVRVEDVRECVERVLRELRHRRRAEVGGVVHEDVQTACFDDGIGESPAMCRAGHIAGDRRHGGALLP